MAIAVRSSTSTSGTSGSRTINVPSGVVDGDYLLLHVVARRSSSTPPSVTTPSGWTLIRGTQVSATARFSIFTFGRVASSEPASYNVTIGTNDGSLACMVAYTGVETASPVDVENGNSATDIHAPTTPSITTTVDDAMIVAFGAVSSSWTWTAPSGMTKVVERTTVAPESATGASGCVATVIQAMAGATGTKAFSVGGSLSLPETVGSHILALVPYVVPIDIESPLPLAEAVAEVLQPLVRPLPNHHLGGISGDAVDFDGTNDYLRTAAALTGVTDSKRGILSARIRVDGDVNDAMRIFCNGLSLGNSNQRFILERGGFGGSAKTLLIGARSASNAHILQLETVSEFEDGPDWIHILASWDLGNGIGHLYINDVSDVDSGKTLLVDDTIHYEQPDWAVGASCGGLFKFNGCMAEVYFAPGEYLDFSVESNRRKFSSAAGYPVDLGAFGNLPTGNTPAVYLKLPKGGSPDDFRLNLGYGGDYAVTGALDTCDSSPYGSGVLGIAEAEAAALEASIRLRIELDTAETIAEALGASVTGSNILPLITVIAEALQVGIRPQLLPGFAEGIGEALDVGISPHVQAGTAVAETVVLDVFLSPTIALDSAESVVEFFSPLVFKSLPELIGVLVEQRLDIRAATVLAPDVRTTVRIASGRAAVRLTEEPTIQ